MLNNQMATKLCYAYIKKYKCLEDIELCFDLYKIYGNKQEEQKLIPKFGWKMNEKVI